MNVLCIGGLRLASPVLLAPMAGYTDLPYRLCIRRLGGVGLAFTELLNPASLLRGGGRKRAQLLATDPADAPLGWQLYGNEPALLAEAAQWLVARGARLLDINMGCPQKKISGRGKGAGLLRDLKLAERVAAAVVSAVAVPVTAKIRLGWDRDHPVAVPLARVLEAVGVAAITVHGRTRAQGYRGKADWVAIGEVVAAVDRIPVIGNGDVDTPDRAQNLLAVTGCAGLMVGRALLKNPWLIRDIARRLEGKRALPAPGRAQWLRFSQAHFRRMTGLYGERIAVVLFRKWLAQYAQGLGLARARLQALYQMREPGAFKRGIGWLPAGAHG